MHWESGISPMAQVYAWQSGSKSVPSLGFSIGSLICNCFFAKATTGWWLNPTPLTNMRSSVGMMKFPTEWENKIHVPNHQPDTNKPKNYSSRTKPKYDSLQQLMTWKVRAGGTS